MQSGHFAMGKSRCAARCCGDVQRPQPWNEEAAIRLIRLAGSILNYHDTFPGSQDKSARLERMNL